MKRRRRRKLRTEENLFLILFFAGFAAGILFLNLWWSRAGAGLEAEGIRELVSLLEGDWDRKALFLRLLKQRGSLWLLAALSGVTVFGAPLAAASAAVLGGYLGLVITLGLLDLGPKGGLLALGVLFPQYLLYVPGVLWLGMLAWRSSLQGWRSREVPLDLYRSQLWKTGVCLLLCLAGMALEVWVNPDAVRFLANRLHIFGAAFYYIL